MFVSKIHMSTSFFTSTSQCLRRISSLGYINRINSTPSMNPLLRISSAHFTECRRNAKRGIIKEDKKKSPRTILGNKEMAKVIPVEDFDARLFGVISKLKSEYNINLSLRTGTGIETLPIELEGEVFPLKEIAQISRKSANIVVINLSAIPDALKPVTQAINSAGMNVSVQQEGSTLILTLPKMTREHRENLAKSARSLFVDAKMQIQNIQNAFTNVAHELQSAGISSDDIHDVCENIKFRSNEAIKKCEEMCKSKTKELLE